MIGMSFLAFATVSAISLVVSVVFFYGLRYRLGPEFEGFLIKIPLAWLGAWLGSPVLGHWGTELNGVYIIPAAIGAVVAIFVATRFFKTVNLVDAHELLEKRDFQTALSQQRVQDKLMKQEPSSPRQKN